MVDLDRLEQNLTELRDLLQEEEHDNVPLESVITVLTATRKLRAEREPWYLIPHGQDNAQVMRVNGSVVTCWRTDETVSIYDLQYPESPWYMDPEEVKTVEPVYILPNELVKRVWKWVEEDPSGSRSQVLLRDIADQLTPKKEANR